MKPVAMWLIALLAICSAFQATAVYAGSYRGKVTEVKPGTIRFSQQEDVALMYKSLPLYADDIYLYEELRRLDYVSAEERMALDGGALYNLMKLEPAYEYFEESVLCFVPWSAEIPYERHIYFSEDCVIIGEYVKFCMGEEVNVGLAIEFTQFVENFSRDNFGYVDLDSSPSCIDVWNYEFKLVNEYDDELRFGWYGQFVVVFLRAGDLRIKPSAPTTKGLLLLSPEERLLLDK